MKVLKVAGWTLLAIIILVSVLLFGAVKFLGSKEFAPVVEDIANDYIDGRVKVGSLKLGFYPRFPILGVEAQDLSIVSHAFDTLSVEERGVLPAYADSLLAIDHLSASVNLKRLLVNNELAISDVVLRGLSINLVIAHNGKGNYELIKENTDSLKASDSRKLKGFMINRFALEDPREIRFYNAADSTSASVLLLTDAAVNGDNAPAYRLKINGNVTSPKATLITNLDRINFGLNGKLFWNPGQPEIVSMDGMELHGAFIKAVISGEIDFKNNLIAEKASVDLKPVALSDLISMLPDSLRQVHHLYEPYFSTDATLAGRFELLKPMDLTTDTIPAALLKLAVKPSTLRYGNSEFKDMALDLTVRTMTNLPDSTVIDISRFTVSSPSTSLNVSAVLSTLFSDPAFDTNVKGQVNLRDLPPIVREKIPGYLSGIITTNLHAAGSASMIKRKHLDRLVADGNVTASDVYFLSADTSKMVEVNKAVIDFDSKRIVDDIPLLKAKLSVDTAAVLAGGVDITFGSLKLDAKVENKGITEDTTLMIPVGGDLDLSRLNIVSITDSAGARIRNVSGHVILKEIVDKGKQPRLMADLKTGQVSAGSLSDRILLNDTRINAILQKLPDLTKKMTVKDAKRTRKKEYSYIAPEAVLKYVYAKRHHKPGQKRTRRVYGTIAADDNEILAWNLTKGFNKFMNQWRLSGSVITKRARFLSPLFPVRNRISLVDVKFNNDTINISDISLRAGNSDLTLSGLVTNVRRAMTSKTDNNLKLNFSILSDTIDINELSEAVMTGAIYSEHRRKGDIQVKGTVDDKALEARIDAFAKKKHHTVAPFLIPVNIDGNLRIEANNVLYSDLMLQQLGGDLLVHDGGVNLHQLKAFSAAGDLNISALYSAPNVDHINVGFGMELADFNISKFVKLVPAIDSIMPLIHDFSGTINAEMAATCRIDSAMNFDLPTLNAAVRITGDNLAFIDPKKYRTLGKWLGFKDKADNTIKHMNVEMTVTDGFMHVFPFLINIDRYRLGIYGSNDIAMNFDYHISVLKSPLPFKFGITIKGDPKKYKVRFGGAKFKEDTAVESINVVNDARINLVDRIEDVFKRGVQTARFAKLQVPTPPGFDNHPDPGLSASDSLMLIKEGMIEAPDPDKASISEKKTKKNNTKAKSKKKRKRFLFF